MREKRKRPVSAGEVLAKTRGTSAIRARMKSWRLWERWEDIAGKAVAEHARPARWQGKALVVRVENPSWMQELSFLKQKLTEKIRSEFPASEIRSIKLELGELPPAPKRIRREPAAAKKPLCKDEREFIERSVERIGDEELKEIAKRAMSRSFETKRR
ncbi:MAG TPA: DUF721 domain-containing protein [bacterium]|nr:DUF721 domain-containing protein [bacterium]